jgi:hypothetical protein
VTENEFDSGAGLEFGQARKTDLAIRLLQKVHGDNFDFVVNDYLCFQYRLFKGENRLFV